jgi:methylglyoxal synthase
MLTKTLALVAHDNKKQELIEWALYNKKLLESFELYATGTTGKLLEAKLDQKINKLMSGPLGGDLQIGAKIAEGEINYLVFFWDPLEAQPHDPDIKALLRIAAVWNIPVACNRATADFIFTSTCMHDDYDRKQPQYKSYLERGVK